MAVATLLLHGGGCAPLMQRWQCLTNAVMAALSPSVSIHIRHAIWALTTALSSCTAAARVTIVMHERSAAAAA